jgi:hypothetical protein
MTTQIRMSAANVAVALLRQLACARIPRPAAPLPETFGLDFSGLLSPTRPEADTAQPVRSFRRANSDRSPGASPLRRPPARSGISSPARTSSSAASDVAVLPPVKEEELVTISLLQEEHIQSLRVCLCTHI